MVILNGIMVLVSIICFVFAYLIKYKQKINIIHNYHHKNVKEEDVAKYTSLMATGMFFIAVGVLLSAILNSNLVSNFTGFAPLFIVYKLLIIWIFYSKIYPPFNTVDIVKRNKAI